VAPDTCNPSYLGSYNWEDRDYRPVQASSSRGPHLQNNQRKIEWRCSSSDRAPALQVLSLEFKPSPTKKERKKEIEEDTYAKRKDTLCPWTRIILLNHPKQTTIQCSNFQNSDVILQRNRKKC
jgi:hypothetical protein